MPSSIRKTLNELPITLDDTYERMLQGIPKEKFEHASRLFQCMVAALRPLRVEELAEIFAIEFGPNDVPNLVPGWRPENPEEAVLSTCSTFITIIDDDDSNNDEKGSKIVQFSHFSVKEFLTSDRLQTSSIGNISQYYTPLEPAHAILARACMSVLLQLDEKEDEERFRALPLASYATTNWARHARFEGVAPRIQDSLAYLFDPKNFRPRILLQGVMKLDYPESVCFSKPDDVIPLTLAAFCGFRGLVKHLIITHALNVNAQCVHGFSSLHEASANGHVDCALILLNHGANVNAQGPSDCTPLHYASRFGHLKVVQLLLEHHANINARTTSHETPLYKASAGRHGDIAKLLLEHGAERE